MPTGYRKAGVDFEDLFDPDIMGDGPEAENVKSGGVPLKFADIAYGTKGDDVGIREGGVDISNKWAAFGTAVYVNPEAIPELMEDSDTQPSAPAVSTVAFTFNSDGSMTLEPTSYGPRSWFSPNSAGVGDDYEIMFSLVSSTSPPGTISFTGGALDTWLPLSSNQGRSLTYTRTISGSATAVREVQVQMRRVPSGAIVFTRTISMEATSDIS